MKKAYNRVRYLKNLTQTVGSVRRRSSVAEQLFCKQLAVSSNLTVGSMGSCRSGQSELAVNQSGFALRRFESFTAHLAAAPTSTAVARADVRFASYAHVAQSVERFLGLQIALLPARAVEWRL